MDLIASFHSHKIKKFHFFSINGLLPEKENLFFLFDTGAVCPVLGINSFFDKDNNPNYLEEKAFLEKIVREELSIQDINPTFHGTWYHVHVSLRITSRSPTH